MKPSLLDPRLGPGQQRARPAEHAHLWRGAVRVRLLRAAVRGACRGERCARAQTVVARQYGHLHIVPTTNGVANVLPAGTFTINRDLVIGNGTNTGTLTAATNASVINVARDVTIDTGTTLTANATQAFTVGGSWTLNGGFTHNDGRVTFNGDGTYTQTINSATTFNKLTFNNSVAANPNRILTLAANVTVSGTAGELTLTNGNIVTGSNVMIVSSPATVTRTNGWVSGNLQKFVATGSPTVTFEVGSNGASAPTLGYSPVDLIFSNVTVAGDVIVSATGATHSFPGTPNVDPTKGVNRYWTTADGSAGALTFTSYSSKLTFLVGDIDGGATTSAFRISLSDIFLHGGSKKWLKISKEI